MRSVRYGYIRTRSHSPALSGPGRSQIEFDTPSRPNPCTNPARRSISTCSGGSPSLRPASSASSATATEWPSVNGDFRSTKFAMAASARSSWSGDSSMASAGSAAITVRQAGTASRPPNISSARAHSSATRAGSNCLPARLRASAVAPGTPLTRCATSIYSASWAILAATGIAPALSTPGQPRPSHCSYAAPTPSRAGPGSSSCSARFCASLACWEIIPSSWRCPEKANSSPTRNRCSGGLPAPTRRMVASAPRTLPSSWAYFPDLSAMSSPNHFACSCASA